MCFNAFQVQSPFPGDCAPTEMREEFAEHEIIYNLEYRECLEQFVQQ